MSFIDTHDPAGLVLRVLGIPESTYYDWRARRAVPSRRELEDAELLERIVKVRSVGEFAATYGSQATNRPVYTAVAGAWRRLSSDVEWTGIRRRVHRAGCRRSPLR